MANDLTIQGEVVVTSEKAEQAFDRVGNKAEQMAAGVARSADDAGKAVDSIGAGAEKGAEKFTRAEARMRDAIKKSTQELQLLGKTASEKLEFNIGAKGLDASKFAPYIAELKKAEEAQKLASGSLDKMGISAAQTAAALRGVPAQFTDIVTSLQGGQQPLTVLLQQGGQLKDMFGGVGAAARALGGYVLGLVNPFTVLAAAAGGVAFAYSQGSKEADAYRMALITTGNAAGTTAGQLQAYARDISGVVGTQGKAAESLAAMAGTGKVVGDMLRESAQAAVMWERATGQAVGKTAEQFASFAGAPLQAVLKMNDSMNFLTLSTYKQIKALEDEGRTTEAAAAAQRAYADALSGRAGEIERNLGSIERGWNRIKDAAKAGWDAILNVGRQNTTQDQLSDTRKRIAQLESQLGGGFGDTGGGAATGRPNGAAQARIQAELAGLKAQEAALQGVAYASKVAAEEEAARAAQVKAAADWDKEGLKYLSDRAKMERELVKARNEGAAAGASQAEIEQRLAAIRESYAKKGSSSHAEENKELREQRRILSELAGVSSTYYADLAAFQSQRAKGLVTEAQYVAAVESLIKKQPFAVELAKQQAEATKLQLQTLEAERVARVAIAQEAEKGAASLVQSNAAMAAEIELIGLSKQEQTAILRQRNDAIILTKQATLAEIERRDAITGTMTREQIALAAEIEALKKRNELLGDKSLREDIAERDKQLSDELARNIQSYDDIFRRGFADMLNRGEDGIKAFGKSLKTTVMTSIADAIYRALAQKFVVNIVGNILGVSGTVGQAAQMATGGNGLMGMASNASSAYSIGTGALGAGFRAGVGGLFGEAGIIGSLDAGVTALGAGNLMGGLGTLAGVAAPFALGVLALGSIFGGKKSTPHMGGAGSYSAEGGASTGLDVLGQGLTFGVGERYYDKQAEQSAVGISQGIVQLLDSTAQSFGQQAGYFAATAFADDSSKDGAWGSLRIMRGDEKILDWADTQTSRWAPKEFADGEQGQKEYAAAIAASARDALKTALGDATWAKDMLDTLGDSVTLEGLGTVVAQINQAKATFVSFGQYMPVFGGLAESAVNALVNAAGGMAPLQAGMATFVDQFYTDAEKLAVNTENVRTALAALGFEMPATRDEFKALVQAQLALGDAGARTAAGLLGLSGAFAGVTQSAEDAAQAAQKLAEEQRRAVQEAMDRAYRDLEAATGRDTKAIDLQRDALNEQRTLAAESLSLITGVFSLVETSARDLFGQVDSVAAMQSAQGRAFIEQALATAQVTGRLPDSQQLSDAISAARGGIDGGTYANDAARNFDRLVLANQLKGLADISGEQKTAQERQIDLLDSQIKGQDKQSKLLQEQLDYWREQIDIASGTLNATLSVSDAVGALQALLFPGSTGQDNAQGSGGAVFGGTSPGGTGWAQQEPARYSQVRSDGSGGNWYDPIRDESVIAHLDKLAPIYHQFDGTGDLAGLAEAIKAAGGTVGDLSALSGYYESDWRKALEAAGIPAFAQGINRVPFDMPAVLHQDELVVPARFNPFNPGAQQFGDNAELIAEMRALRAEVAALRASGDATADSMKTTAGVLVRVTGNGNGMLIVPAPI